MPFSENVFNRSLGLFLFGLLILSMPAAATQPVSPTTPTPLVQSTPPTSTQSAGTGKEQPAIEVSNSTNAQRGGVFQDKEISTLPPGGTWLVRRVDELSLLLPGVANPPQTQGLAAGPGV
jgi:hypothetical protein